MYKISLIAFFVLLSSHLSAKCASGGLDFFPTGKEIKLNSIFMVEGYNSESIINGINKEYPIYLKSDNHIVKLKILERRLGAYGLSQVLLQPTELLMANKEYEIIIDNYPVNEPLRRKKSEVFRKWKVINKKDIKKPMFEDFPKEVRKVSEMYGCRPEVFVKFRFNVSDESECLIKTVVRDIKTNGQRTYYLPISKGEVEVGHNMCAGAFKYEYDEDYEVTFSIIDASGNENSKDAKTIAFKSPKQPS
jgi:hypothetical protein